VHVKELLTGLFDGAGWSEVAVLICGLDNFTRVNDSLGHDAGDEVLVALARVLRNEVPEGCTAARMSGDEFAVVCEGVDRVGGVDGLLVRVLTMLRTAVTAGGQTIHMSASGGAATPPDANTTGDDLLRFANAAMAKAKRGGAGRAALASPALIETRSRQLQLEGELRDALDRGGLVLHYQPAVNALGTILSGEALVRWQHPERGLLPPDVLLPVADQGDMLRQLDLWVLRAALREAAGWPEDVSVAVNLSRFVPGDPEFEDVLMRAVEDTGTEWDRVVLELVETALVDLPSRVRRSMNELIARGVRFAIDDFGTGYSSLARFKDLPAEIIKIDRRFVSGVGNDSSDFAVARAIVDMTRAMNRTCVAEGVENSAQFHALRGIGPDAYQGWLFSRPVPAPEFRAMLSTGPLPVPKTE
jgi:diguanylate cyclase (GGDEF)-like protein